MVGASDISAQTGADLWKELVDLGLNLPEDVSEATIQVKGPYLPVQIECVW